MITPLPIITSKFVLIDLPLKGEVKRSVSRCCPCIRGERHNTGDRWHEADHAVIPGRAKREPGTHEHHVLR